MFKKYKIEKIEVENSIIKSFYLKQTDGNVLPDYKPGQFITIKVKIENQKDELIRNYTLSDKPNKNYFRVTLKREEGGKISTFFHDKLRIGDFVDVANPSGKFFLNTQSKKPVVMLSGGIGITPMMSMLEYISANQPDREVNFVHSSRNKKVQPMLNRLKELASKCDNINLFINHSKPNNDEQMGIDYDLEGKISQEFLSKILPNTEMDYYLCGPIGYMETMYSYLINLGISENNIHYEFFGEGKKLGTKPIFIDSGLTNFKVKFTKSNKLIDWNDKHPNILDLAESIGLLPDSSCRMGTCFTCESRLIRGSIEYDPEPFIDVAGDKVLICCAKPASDIEIEI